MATRPRRPGFRTQPSLRPVYQDFKPKLEVKENPEALLLQIQLAGFTKERLRVQFDSSSRMLEVSGERPIDGGNRRSRFREVYPVPKNCNVDEIGSNFYQGILTITMPKKLISKAEVDASQEQAPAGPPPKVIPPTPRSARKPRDKKTASAPSTSGTGPDDMKAHKSQEETPSQIPSEKQADGKPRKVQEEPEPKQALKMVPRKPTDEEPQKEIELKPELTMAATQEKQTDKTEKVQEETEPKPILKMDPGKVVDANPQKGKEENAQKPKAPEKQTYDKPQKVQQETEPKPTLEIAPKKTMDEKHQKVQEETELKPTLEIAPRKTIDEKPHKGQEETEPKPAITMVPRKTLDEKPEKGQEGTKQNAQLTSVTRKQPDEKAAARRDEDAEKERVPNKEIIEGKPSESTKPDNSVVEKDMVTEQEIRARELAKTEELSVTKTPEKEKETTSKTAAAAVTNGWNLNDGLIDSIGKGIKEVTTSASQAFTRIAEGKWDDEDKPLLLNMGASILVLAAAGIYAFYGFSSSERT